MDKWSRWMNIKSSQWPLDSMRDWRWNKEGEAKRIIQINGGERWMMTWIQTVDVSDSVGFERSTKGWCAAFVRCDYLNIQPKFMQWNRIEHSPFELWIHNERACKWLHSPLYTPSNHNRVNHNINSLLLHIRSEKKRSRTSLRLKKKRRTVSVVIPEAKMRTTKKDLPNRTKAMPAAQTTFTWRVLFPAHSPRAHPF